MRRPARAAANWRCSFRRISSRISARATPIGIRVIRSINRPGEYHNGGIWPFICGFYVVAVLAAGYPRLAERKLQALTELVRPACNPELAFGFNEWLRAQDGTPRGNDWQTWSAALYLYAATCVEQGRVLYFEHSHAN